MAAIFRGALADSRPFLIAGGLTAIHFATAFFCFPFVTRSKPSQFAAIAGATVILGITTISAVIIAGARFLGNLTRHLPYSTLALVKPCIYGWLAYELFVLMRASNNRHGKPTTCAQRSQRNS
jgi:hypothetical protein